MLGVGWRTAGAGRPAAAGAKVTVFDNSLCESVQDQFVAVRDNLTLDTIVGDMANLSAFDDETFDLIFHPASNCFAPDIRPVWRECFRVLRRGGDRRRASPIRSVMYLTTSGWSLASSRFATRFLIPICMTSTRLVVSRSSTTWNRSVSVTSWKIKSAGQLEAGFVLTGFDEDYYNPEANDPSSRYLPTFIATRAVKP